MVSATKVQAYVKGVDIMLAKPAIKGLERKMLGYFAR
jgi:hypothetical protein